MVENSTTKTPRGEVRGCGTPLSLWTINIEEISKNSKNFGNFNIVFFGVEN